MPREINIGGQEFEEIRNSHAFYIDKSSFIKEWWEDRSFVIQMMRPHLFGKTVNMSMLKCFFSNQYEGRSDLFEGLDIWKEEKYRQLQGTYPVIYLDFQDIKGSTFTEAKKSLIDTLKKSFSGYQYLWKDEKANSWLTFLDLSLDSADFEIACSLNDCSIYLEKVFHKKVLIMIDGCDDPLQKAYINGYYDEMAGLLLRLFESSFKSNRSLERGLLAGTVRVPKASSIFSGFNNLDVRTITDEFFETSFGFTEDEVCSSLDEYGLSDQKENVRKWYGGYTIGSQSNIYNPWSIANYLKFKEFDPYWADTSSNALFGTLLQKSSNDVKETMIELLNDQEYITSLDKQITFDRLNKNDSAIWSLMLAGGYLGVRKMERAPETMQKIYHLVITDFEVKLMFEKMISGWFTAKERAYHCFQKALLENKRRRHECKY